MLYDCQSAEDAVEPESTATLAFKVIDQGTQHGIFLLTSRTVVNILTMCRTAKMLVQGSQGMKPILAKVAAEKGSVPRNVGSQRWRIRCIVVPPDLLVSEDVIGVHLLAVSVDLLPIDSRAARPRFKMQTDSSEIGEHVGTPRTLHILSNVN